MYDVFRKGRLNQIRPGDEVAILVKMSIWNTNVNIDMPDLFQLYENMWCMVENLN